MGPSKGISLSVVMDRLIHASNSPDARASLEEVQKRCKSSERKSNIEGMLKNEEFLASLMGLIGSGKLPEQGVRVEEGQSMACEVVLSMLGRPTDDSSSNSSSSSSSSSVERQAAKMLLSQSTPHAPPAFMSALLDLLCGASDLAAPPQSQSNEPPDAYARILAMDTLRRCTQLQPSLTQEGIVSSPDGPNRLVDLLTLDSSEPVDPREEAIRNGSLVLLTQLCHSSPVLRRLMVFAEGFEKALNIATSPEHYGGAGGLQAASTGNAAIVQDGLSLCIELARVDGSVDMLLGSTGVLDCMLHLLDATKANAILQRGAMQLYYDDPNTYGPANNAQPPTTNSAAGSPDAMTMEDLLRDYVDNDNSSNNASSARKRRPPQLTPEENQIMMATLRLLSVAIMGGAGSIDAQLLTSIDTATSNTTTTSTRVYPKPSQFEPLDSSSTQALQRRITMLLHSSNHTTARHVLCQAILGLALYREACFLERDDVGQKFHVAAPSLETQCVALELVGDLCRDRGDIGGAAGGGGGVKPRDLLMKKTPLFNPDLTITPPQQQQPPEEDTGTTIIDHVLTLCSTPCPPTYTPPTPNTPTSTTITPTTLATAAVSTLRTLLTQELSSIYLMHTLAPPPQLDSGEMVKPVVQRVVDHLAEVLLDDVNAMNSNHHGGAAGEYACAAIVGGSGALGVLLQNGGEVAKEMLLRVQISPSVFASRKEKQTTEAGDEEEQDASLVAVILQWLEACATMQNNTPLPSHTNAEEWKRRSVIKCAMYRLLCEWSDGCTTAVKAMVSRSESFGIVGWIGGVTKSSNGGSGNGNEACVERGWVSLLLGLWLEHLGDEEHAGWSRDVIMTMLKSNLGISKFTSFLEAPRKDSPSTRRSGGAGGATIGGRGGCFAVTYPWNAMDAEQYAVVTWYSSQVAVVRRRLVQQITASNPNSAEEGVAGESLPHNTSSNDQQSYAAMVQQQAVEIQELRQALSEANSELSLKQSECNQWRNRCSTNEDDAYTQQIAKAVEAERVAVELKQQLEQQKGEYEGQLQAKEQEVESLKVQVKDVQEKEAQGREDVRRMTEELGALSQAYADLEAEFRRQTGGGGGGASSQETKAGEDPHQTPASQMQTTGSATSATGAGASTAAAGSNQQEVMALRHEVEQLRNSSRAADEWMAMAVQRMEALNVQNAQLDAELQRVKAKGTSEDATSTAQSPPPQTATDNTVSTNSSADQLALQEELQQAKTKISTLEQQLLDASQTAEQQIQNLQQDLAQASPAVQQVATLQQQLKEATQGKDGQVTQLQRQLADTKQDNEQQVQQLQQERDQANTASRAATEQIQQLQAQLAEASRAAEQAAQLQRELAQASNTTEQVQMLQRQLAEANQTAAQVPTLQQQMSDASSASRQQLSQKQLELDQAKKQIVDLHAELDAAEKVYDAKVKQAASNAQTEELQGEVASLRQANEEAQAWMSQAVAHHEALNAEIQTLKEQVEAEKALVKEEQSKTNEAALKGLQEKLDASTAEVRRLTGLHQDAQSRVQDLEQQLGKLQADLSTAVAKSQTLKEQSKEAQDVQSKLASAQEEKELLEKEVQAAKNETTTVREELTYVREQSLVETDRLHGQLSEAEARVLEVEGEMTNYKEDERTLKEEMASLQSSTEALRKQLADVSRQRDDLLSTQSRVSEEEVERVKELSDQLQELEKEKKLAEDRLKMWSESEEKWSARTAELETQLEEVRKELEDSERDASKAAEEKDALQKEYSKTMQQHQAKVFLLEETIASAKAQSEQLSAEFFKLEHSKETLEAKLAETQKLLTDANNELAGVNDVKGELSTKVADLEEAARNDADRIRKQEDQIQTFQIQVTAQQKELLAARDEIAEMRVGNKEKDKITAELRDAVEEGRNRLENAERQHQEVIELIQADLTAKNEENIALLEQLGIVGEQSTDVVNQWKERSELLDVKVEELEERNRELEVTIEELEASQNEQLEGATDAIAQWEAQCMALKEQFEALQEGASAEHLAQMEAEVEALQQSLNESHEREEAVVQDLINTRQEATEKFEEMQNMLATAGQTQEDLELRLKETCDAVDLEQSKLAAADAKLSEQQKEILSMKKLHDELTASLDMKTSLESKARDELEREREVKKVLEQKYATEKHQRKIGEEKVQFLENKAKEDTKQWDEERCAFEQRVSDASSEADKCQAVITRLRGEMRDAQETLRSYVTDDISSKATVKVTDALRSQLAEVRLQLESCKENLNLEREGRLSAERKMEEMKADLSVLVECEADSTKDVSVQIRNYASKAADARSRRERNELADLKDNLARALSDLSESKMSEKQAEKHAAACSLAASLSEKEKVAAKQDAARLAQTVQQIREEEQIVLKSLQSKLVYMETDRELTRKSFQDQIDALKMELTECVKERDRLTHALREVESANATLVSKSVNGVNGGQHEGDEMARLRLEKAHLVSSILESSSKTEERIRGVVAAHSSSCDAELVLERELRLSVEAALVEKQSQIDHLLKEARGKTRTQNDAHPDDDGKEGKRSGEVQELNEQLARWIDQEKQRREEIKHLEEELQEAKASKAKVEEEYHAAMTEAWKVRSDRRFEGNVVNEVGRLRVESHQIPSQNGGLSPARLPFDAPISMNGKLSEAFSDRISAEVMYDMILELRSSVKEERELYHDLLSEHEDLLALLAQQDLERSSFQGALLKLGGESAVKDAILQSEESALSRFGEYVTLG